MARTKNKEKIKKLTNKKFIYKKKPMTSKLARENVEENVETNDASVLELMTKHPELNQTFEYILYSNKYKHTITDVFNIINMLISKLEELQKHDVDIKNIFETIHFNYKIKGLVQSTAINLSHVVDQLNVNESTFLNFAHNFTPLKVTNDNKNIKENMTVITNAAPIVTEIPVLSSSSVCNNNSNLPKEIKIENITNQLINTELFGSNYTIVLSSDDEYTESSHEHNNQNIAERDLKNKDKDLESYVMGSDFNDISSNYDSSSPETTISPKKNKHNTTLKLSSQQLNFPRKLRNIKQKVSNEVINEARNSDFRLRKRLTTRNHDLFKIVKELKLQPHDIILEFDTINKKPLLTIQKDLAKVLKKHQVEGVRFVWNTVFETMNKTNTTEGTGCILAHRMGVGKTLQIITLMYTILCQKEIDIKTFLIICPPGLIYNWMDEIYKWLKDIDKNDIVKVYDLPKTNKLYNITNIATWKTKGGILLLSYENFKSLVNCKQSDLRESFSHALIDPGPDVVILDEGHYIKNTNTILLKSLLQIRTKRRIVLTGTPMQNSLKEYYAMVNFVKPFILGNFRDFATTFIKPIDSGQFIDSTDEAVKIMKQRTFVLHKLLQNTVHRIDDRKIRPLFTEKIEYTLEVNMTDFQCELYKKFLHYNKTSHNNCSVFLCLHVLTLITLHPLTLYRLIRFRNSKQPEFGTASFDKKFANDLKWIADYGDDARFFDAKQSNKIMFTLSAIEECLKRKEKALCYLKSPLALDAVEFFLLKEKKWVLGKDYFRMDGKTPLTIRNQMCEAFNNSENPAKLFLLSLGTGFLGYNMVGANRVLLLSTSWNPSNDLQAIYRCLRFGQKKTVYVNRLLAKGTVEPKTYYRQISKLGMASSVLDFQHMNRKVSYEQTNDLFTFDLSKNNSSLDPNTKDPVLNQFIKFHSASISDLKEHDTMLVESVEEELTHEERKHIWLSFKNNKLDTKSLIKLKSKNLQNNIVYRTKNKNSKNEKQKTNEDLSASISNSQYEENQNSLQNINEMNNSNLREFFNTPKSLLSPKPKKLQNSSIHQTKSKSSLTNIKQEPNEDFSASINNSQYEEQQNSLQNTYENNSSNLHTFLNTSKPQFSGNHIKFNDNSTFKEKLTTSNSELQYNNYGNRNQWKNDEPIQNQFRNFQAKTFGHYKRYPSSNYRPHPFAGSNSRYSNTQRQQSPSQVNKTWSSNRTPTENNIHNRSGMSR